MPRSSSCSTGHAVKLVLLAEAQFRFEAEDAWWREHRDATDLFIDEFTQTLELLSSTPEVGQAYRIANTLSWRSTRSGALVESAARSSDPRTANRVR